MDEFMTCLISEYYKSMRIMRFSFYILKLTMYTIRKYARNMFTNPNVFFCPRV